MKTSLPTSVTLFGLLNALLACSLGAAPFDSTSPEPGSRPCKIIETVAAIYPDMMRDRGVSQGTARLMLQIDMTGRLVDVLVTAYTHKPFADEALRAVREWKFEPGYSRGEPITTIMNLTFKFEVNGLIVRDVWGGTPTSWGGSGMERYEFEARGAGKLDRLPVPLKIVPPPYPQEWADQGITGSVTVEFYIDDTGKVRMPHSPASTNDRLVGLALDAVRQWEFSPPTWQGKPALTHARQVLKFEKKPAAEAGQPVKPDGGVTG